MNHSLKVSSSKGNKLVMIWMDQQEYNFGKKLSGVKHGGGFMELHNWRIT